MGKRKGLTSRQMSRLYKKLLNKGISKRKAFKITGKAKKISKYGINQRGLKTKIKYPYLDFDGDKKVNKYDCKPYNRWKQDKETIDKIDKDEIKVDKSIKEDLKRINKDNTTIFHCSGVMKDHEDCKHLNNPYLVTRNPLKKENDFLRKDKSSTENENIYYVNRKIDKHKKRKEIFNKDRISEKDKEFILKRDKTAQHKWRKRMTDDKLIEKWSEVE